MSIFNKFVSLFIVGMLFFSGCDTSSDEDICPQCNMPISKDTSKYTSIITTSKKIYFDVIGCMVLYAQDHDIDLKHSNTQVFTNDTHIYKDAYTLYYKIDESTPMHYGFGAYENKVKNSIRFDEVILKMLRGENMTNPKIRKQILGY